MKKKIIEIGVRQPKKLGGRWTVTVDAADPKVYDDLRECLTRSASEVNAKIVYVAASPWGDRPRTIGEGQPASAAEVAKLQALAKEKDHEPELL